MLRMIMEFVSHILGIQTQGESSSANNAENAPEIPVSTNNVVIFFKNNSERLKKEFRMLETENPELKTLLLDLANYTVSNFGKGIVITMITRLQEEQDEIYAGTERNGRKYDENPWKSPHQFWHSADLRSSTFSGEEIEQIEDYLNAKYNMDNYYDFTAKCHDVGLGDHFHLQFYKV